MKALLYKLNEHRKRAGELLIDPRFRKCVEKVQNIWDPRPWLVLRLLVRKPVFIKVGLIANAYLLRLEYFLVCDSSWQPVIAVFNLWYLATYKTEVKLKLTVQVNFRFWQPMDKKWVLTGQNKAVSYPLRNIGLNLYCCQIIHKITFLNNEKVNLL